jgi:hypothetical protein
VAGGNRPFFASIAFCKSVKPPLSAGLKNWQETTRARAGYNAGKLWRRSGHFDRPENAQNTSRWRALAHEMISRPPSMFRTPAHVRNVAFVNSNERKSAEKRPKSAKPRTGRNQPR